MMDSRSLPLNQDAAETNNLDKEDEVMALLLEIDTGTAIVRIHSGERTEEERNAAIKKAAERYLRAVYPQLERLGLLDQLTRSVSTEDTAQSEAVIA